MSCEHTRFKFSTGQYLLNCFLDPSGILNQPYLTGDHFSFLSPSFHFVVDDPGPLRSVCPVASLNLILRHSLVWSAASTTFHFLSVCMVWLHCLHNWVPVILEQRVVWLCLIFIHLINISFIFFRLHGFCPFFMVHMCLSIWSAVSRNSINSAQFAIKKICSARANFLEIYTILVFCLVFELLINLFYLQRK